MARSLHPTAVLIGTCLAAAPGHAQTAPDAATIMAPVTTTATRSARSIDEVPATVTVIDAQQLERQNAVRPQDAIRYEPGISFGNSPLRGGGGNFVIRGIGENRVRVLTDGVRLPDFPESNVGAGTFNRDFVDLENVRRLEIVRGPASALYGSDAIGGVVNYITKDPGDYLTAGRSTYVGGRFGYSGADRSTTANVTGAARMGDVDAMILYTRRDGHEVRPRSNTLLPNRQDYNVNSLLGRLVWRATPSDTFRLTGEYLERNTSTNIATDRVTTGAGAAATTVQNSRGEDTTTRGRVQLDYTRADPVLFADRIDVRTFWSRLDRREQTTQDRYVGAGSPSGSAPNRLRYTNTLQEQETAGIDLQARTAREFLGATHRLTYGATLDRVATARPRDRFETNLTTGASTRTVAGETYPNKNFPDTTTYQAGLFLQDEFAYGRFTFLPAIRLDWYSLQTQRDAAFQRSAASVGAGAIRNLDAFAASPKFGVTYRIDPTYSVYAQYARGFRAPPYDTANFGFSNRTLGYEIVPNGNLRPESVNGLEAGFRGRFREGSSFQLAGFYNRFSNFIATEVIGIVGGLQQFQYRNLNSVEIYGFEARGDWRINPEWRARAALAYARGANVETGRSVDGVDPFRISLGVAWQAPAEGRLAGLGAEANVTAATRNYRVSSPTYFRAPAYGVLDLAAHYDFGRGVTLNVGLFNVTNTRYFLTPDVSGLAGTNPLRDLYAQAGRYGAVNLIARF